MTYYELFEKQNSLIPDYNNAINKSKIYDMDIIKQCETKHELELLKFKHVQENKSLLFAEWLDLEGIRNDIHQWKWKGDNYIGRYTTKKMYIIFEDEFKKSIN